MAIKKKRKGSRKPWFKPEGLLTRVEAEDYLGFGKHWISHRTHVANAPAVTWDKSRPLYKKEDLDRFKEERARTGSDPAHNIDSVNRPRRGGGPRPKVQAAKEAQRAPEQEAQLVKALASGDGALTARVVAEALTRVRPGIRLAILGTTFMVDLQQELREVDNKLESVVKRLAAIEQSEPKKS